jgi:hypothetical protein
MPVPDDPKPEPSGDLFAPTSTGSRIYINAKATRRLVESCDFQLKSSSSRHMEAGSTRDASRHRALMRAAIEREAEAQRAALAGEIAASESAFLEASDIYRQSWESAPPGSYGRLVGMLKAAILGGHGTEAAGYVQRALGDAAPATPTAAYAAALAALVLGEDDRASSYAHEMRAGSDAFARAAAAIEALAGGEHSGYSAALREIVADFEARQAHLTGVAMADTAAMLERLAAVRGLGAGLESPLLPPRRSDSTS